ncbi:MAG: alpha/beta fold hydrolase [Candidatus Omnitrophica bacterium]|nr:alpha/beta fold hydrolase [Candidatus Omnitrophota bacterium]
MKNLFNELFRPRDPYSLFTEDGIGIAFHHYRKEGSKVIILAHGFYNNKDAYLFRYIAASIFKEYPVISFDFRGHGQSEGLFSWTSDEEKDLRAVIAYARQNGYEKIGVVGFSLGAAVAIVEAAKNDVIDSVIAVSAPYDFWKINCHFWKEDMLDDLVLNVGPKGKGKGVRPGSPFREKVSPISVVNSIAPKPILFIHGKKDWLIHYSHSEKLFEAAEEPKKIVILEGAGHAERICDVMPEEFERLCFDWFRETL